MATINTGKKIYQDINVVDGDGQVIVTIDNDPNSSHYIGGVDSADCAVTPLPPQNKSTLSLRLQNNSGRFLKINNISLISQSKQRVIQGSNIDFNPNMGIIITPVTEQVDEFYNLIFDMTAKVDASEMKRFQGVRLNYIYNGVNLKQVPLYNPNLYSLQDMGIKLAFQPQGQINTLQITII